MPVKIGKGGVRQVRRPRLPTVAFEAIPGGEESKLRSESLVRRAFVEVQAPEAETKVLEKDEESLDD
ncbi:MAG: hypothetical protein ACI9MR_001362 [Myxococcota bacterium]|jgi:hypothetical protein